MRNGKHGLRVLVLAAVAALGVMAFGAAGAQAQAPELPGKSTLGTFTVNGGVPSGQALVGEQLGLGNLLVKARDLEIRCTGGTVNTAIVKNSTDVNATVTFTGCVAYSHSAGTPLKGCQFKELETIKASALALPILHGGERFVLFEPLTGATEFANVTFKSGTVCTLPLNNPVTGSVVAKVVNPAVPAEQLLEGASLGLVFSEAVQVLSGDVLKYGALQNTAYVNATADVELEGGGNLGVH